MSFPSVKEIFEDRNLATLILIVMSVQFVFWEGFTISIPKVVFMCCMFPVFLTRCAQLTNALILGYTFLLVTLFMCEFQPIPPRYSTLGYSLLFINTFIVYYNLVWIKNCFSIDYFIKLTSCFIYAYCICLILQQIFLIIGIRSFSLINLGGWDIYHLRSLAIEPSQAGRLLAVFFYAFLKATEYANGSPLKISELFKQYKWVILAFLDTIIGIGSGTAMVGLAIVSLYFVRKTYAFFIILTALLVYITIPYLDYEPLNRAMATFNAALTGDTQEVIKADHSASTRVNILLDTFNKLDLSDSQIWIGYGIDAQREYAINRAIYDYGLISYIFKILFFMVCCFTGFFTIETLMFILLFGMNVGNIAYGWSALMFFSAIKYFKQNYYQFEPHITEE